jgi:hypothetical protein
MRNKVGISLAINGERLPPWQKGESRCCVHVNTCNLNYNLNCFRYFIHVSVEVVLLMAKSSFGFTFCQD